MAVFRLRNIIPFVVDTAEYFGFDDSSVATRRGNQRHLFRIRCFFPNFALGNLSPGSLLDQNEFCRNLNPYGINGLGNQVS
jgi:hypothetical protein